ncbi:phospholipase a2, putative [Babesia ovis]|uniref:Clathrin light chain n=1 Tax=Babesia ovis TaxID=5869 RepID=A0A9W5WTJ8_BABOV|nr:phospholipase a2, putative [Babesia ovis]
MTEMEPSAPYEAESNYSGGALDVDDILGACDVTFTAPKTNEKIMDPDKELFKDSSKHDNTERWRTDMQATVEKKKQQEAEAMQAAVEKGKQELDAWNKARKEKIEAKKSDEKDDNKLAGNERAGEAFSWKKTADLLIKIGLTPNDQNGKSSQKMADLIFARANQ